MEISPLPGTALVLESGGLDAPPHSLEEGQNSQIEENIGERKTINAEEEDGLIQDENEKIAEELKEEEKARNRVIVRRRKTRGGGFFTKNATPTGRNEGGEEEIGGEQQVERSRSTVTPIRPKYSTIRSGIIKLTPESMKCKLYCRGVKCIYCNPENWTNAQQAIRGLFSNWITENLLAMARPTQRTFQEFDLIGQFKKAKVKTIFNLQCVNEHDYCGSPLVSHTGFSYDPEIFMRKKVFYYNFAVPDFGILPVQSILNIVKVIWFSLRSGRVAIHCHAGLGRTGTLIACFLVWSKCLYTSNAIDLVREARPNSIQSVEQINLIEEFAFYVHKYGTALPSAFYSSSGGISLRQLMANQRQFLPNEEARQFAHIPKLLYMLGDRLLRLVFEKNGIHYAPPCGHHARSCTFGTIRVNWRNAFTAKGKLKVRQIVNLLARCSAFPYERDQALINKFQQLSLVTVDQLVLDMDEHQLVNLLNAFMESIKKPYCSRKSLIEALGHFSPDNPTGPIPESDENEVGIGNGGAIDREDLELVDQLMNPRGGEGLMEEELVGGEKCKNEGERGQNDGQNVGQKVNESRPESAFNGMVKRHSITTEKCAKIYGGISLEDVNEGGRDANCANNEVANAAKLICDSNIDFNGLQFDNHDSHTNKEANLTADWQCIVFYLCNLLSYLTGENYDAVVDLLTFWFTGDTNRDVKQAIYCHMRDLFARNMRQQEQQAAEWRRRMGLLERQNNKWA